MPVMEHQVTLHCTNAAKWKHYGLKFNVLSAGLDSSQ